MAQHVPTPCFGAYGERVMVEAELPGSGSLCRVGITCDLEAVADRRGATEQRLFLPRAYATAVAAAGGDPLALPIADPGSAERTLDAIDGLVVSGGNFDIPPRYFGEEPRPGLGRVLEERTAFEHALLRAAMRRDMPVLGICGGMQLMAVVMGGTLFQDLSERPGTDVHEQPHLRSLPQHPVSLTQRSRLAEIFAAPQIRVNSTHHQAVRAAGAGVVICGTAPDGVIEAIEVPALTWCIGVQWHPEALDEPHHKPLFAALAQAIRARPGRPRLPRTERGSRSE